MTVKRQRAMDRNLLAATFELSQLDAEAKRLPHEDPVMMEVCKALTLALLHAEIEARVVCKNLLDAAKAICWLRRRTEDPQFAGSRWNYSGLELALKNGSAVVVKVELPADDADRQASLEETLTAFEWRCE